MSKIRHCLGISVSNCCISSVLFCSKYFSTRRVSSFTKISNHTSKVSYQKYIKSLPLRFGGVYPFFSVISISVGDYQYLSTQTSPGEHALTEEDLNRILSEIEKNPILDSYSNLAKAFLKSTDTVHILQLVKEVSELTFQGSATVMNRIISSFDKSGQIDTALLIFDHMKDLKCKPDTITFNTVLAILGRAGRVDELLHQFSSMKETNMVPDVVSYNTLITSLRKLGRMDLCLVFVQEMCERGLKPDLRTYTALIEGFGRLGHTEEALRLLGDMKTRGVCPSIYIYRGLISNLKKIGKFELAINLEAEINSSFSDLIGPKDFKRSYR
ncbi:pentatricopeptide repeat-containing protein At1g11900-like isoform X2 [Papaver somniferum]|uniref:pentatricopeptide repeat-containing protein At1g11900-like isoform X2 n=1 Tax=Papaver somniferum TaxID=3469 RepID=UPI000E700F41|nr:pentatricopeptide repeat-containing protein At1g11900-like isoform X2 [Papaver somniferum]